MSTYTKLLFHIVFTTKHREPTLSKDNRDILFKNMNAILTNKNCKPYRINGVEDHVHILVDVNPSVSISELVKSLKLGSTVCIKRDNLFKDFKGWQSGYGVFSCSIEDKNRLMEYIKNQEAHHQIKTFRNEYIDLLNENGIEFDDQYLL